MGENPWPFTCKYLFLCIKIQVKAPRPSKVPIKQLLGLMYPDKTYSIMLFRYVFDKFYFVILIHIKELLGFMYSPIKPRPILQVYDKL